MPGSDSSAADPLDQQPVLLRGGSARALDELIAQERTRQDARLSALRRLRGDAAALTQTEDGARAQRSSLWQRLAASLQRERAPSEQELRERYEAAQLRTRRAMVFAEALSGLEAELADEIARLRGLLVDLAKDEDALDALLLRVRGVAGDAAAQLGANADPSGQRANEVRAERARARADQLEGQRDRLRATEDRLLHLVEGERMLAERLRALRQEVERATQAGARQLDLMSDQLRALATTSDATRVVKEMDGALADMLSTLQQSARAARDALGGDDDP